MSVIARLVGAVGNAAFEPSAGLHGDLVALGAAHPTAVKTAVHNGVELGSRVQQRRKAVQWFQSRWRTQVRWFGGWNSSE